MFAQLKEKTVWTAIVRLGVFFFVFLGLEYLFDNLMAAVTDSTGVVRAQSYVLGVSAMGFLAYGMLPERIRNAGHRTPQIQSAVRRGGGSALHRFYYDNMSA